MTGRQILCAIALLLIVVGMLVAFVIPEWLWHPLGECTGNSCGYQLWSGIAGSCVTGSGIWTGAVAMWWHRTCHAPGCLRFGKHPTADGAHVLCAKHHPDMPDAGRTLVEIHAAHHTALNERTTR